MKLSETCSRQETEQWIEDKLSDIIRDLARICRIRSVAELEHPEVKPYGEGCREVLDEMLSMGKEAGFAVRNYDDYVGCISYGGTEEEYQKKAIGIWAHLDVVDEGDASKWQYSPYEPCVKDGYFIARGSQDNKSSAIVALYTMKYLKEHGIRLRHGLQLYVGTCEEQGMYDLDYYVRHYPAPALSLVPDSGFPVCYGERGIFNGELISAEPVSDEILELECNGSRAQVPDLVRIRLKGTKERLASCEENPLPEDVEVEIVGEDENILCVTAHGIATHTACPQRGKNALLVLTGFLLERGLLSGKDRDLFEYLHAINRDYSGRALQIFCEDEESGVVSATAAMAELRDRHLVIGFFSRLPIRRNDFPFEENASQAAKEHGYTLQVKKLSKSNFFDPRRPAVSVLTEVYNSLMGTEAKPFVMSGGTYASKLPNAFAFGTGMPLPKAPQGLFLPGHGDYHQPDESIALERIKKAILVYICGILKLNEEEVL